MKKLACAIGILGIMTLNNAIAEPCTTVEENSVANNNCVQLVSDEESMTYSDDQGSQIANQQENNEDYRNDSEDMTDQNFDNDQKMHDDESDYD